MYNDRLGVTKVLDNRGREISPRTIHAIRLNAAHSRPYEAAGYDHKDMRNWHAPNISGQGALDYDRGPITDRIHDIARNDGWASAAMDRQVDQVIGAFWNLSVRLPDRLLGISPEAADELAEQIESEWELFSANPHNFSDRSRERCFTAQLALGFRHKIMDGEALAVLHYEERGGHYGTMWEVIDPARLSNPHGRINDEFLRDGVELDENGAACAYHFSKTHPGDLGFYQRGRFEWERVARETQWGRPIVLHAFDAKRAGQKRGEPPLAPILRKFRQVTRYDDLEIQAASMNAIMAAFIESPFDHELLADSQGLDSIRDYNRERFEHYDKYKFELPGAQLGFLYSGEHATLTKPEHPNAVYENYIRVALRNIASAAGITYEQLTQDWSGVNYSSARAALVEVYKTVTTRRARFSEQIVTPFYWAFLEEAFGIGRLKVPTGAPSFEAVPHLYARCKWIAPGRGWVDPLKEAQGAGERMDQLLSPLQDELAEQGRDFRETMDQIARERRILSDNKLQRGGDGASKVPLNEVTITD